MMTEMKPREWEDIAFRLSGVYGVYSVTDTTFGLLSETEHVQRQHPMLCFT